MCMRVCVCVCVQSKLVAMGVPCRSVLRPPKMMSPPCRLVLWMTSVERSSGNEGTDMCTIECPVQIPNISTELSMSCCGMRAIKNFLRNKMAMAITELATQHKCACRATDVKPYPASCSVHPCKGSLSADLMRLLQAGAAPSHAPRAHSE